MRRKSKSSSSASTRYNSRATSPLGSQNGSRDASPRSRSPDQSSYSSSWRTGGKNSSNEVSVEEEYEEIQEESEDTVEKIRVCMMGDNGVGKTALVSQFLTSDYIDTYDASLGELFDFLVFSLACTFSFLYIRLVFYNKSQNFFIKISKHPELGIPVEKAKK